MRTRVRVGHASVAARHAFAATLAAGLGGAPLVRAEGAARADCTLVVEAASGAVLARDGSCETRVTPASTFKIAIALMGYDAGVLVDEHTPALPFREGYPDWLPAWRTTTDPTSWIRNSVVWYSQQVTQALGEARFRTYATAFRYGNADVSGDPGRHDGLTRAWLSSSLKISPAEQVDFLTRLVRRQVPVSARALDMTARVTILPDPPDGWEFHGKTGTGAPVGADGGQDWDHAYGWFVGWATKGERTLVFARLTQDGRHEAVSAGLRARDAFLRDWPRRFAAP